MAVRLITYIYGWNSRDTGMRWKLPEKIHWGAISTGFGIGVGVATLVYTAWTYGVSADQYKLAVTKEQRELNEKKPAIEMQVTHTGVSSASLLISITNRGDVAIMPLDITVDHSFEVGDLYLTEVVAEPTVSGRDSTQDDAHDEGGAVGCD